MQRNDDRIELRLLTHRPGLKSSLLISSCVTLGKFALLILYFFMCKTKIILNPILGEFCEDYIIIVLFY